ncbi:MAG: hypothetical protein KGZ61_11535 [Sandarakinorhabdus sp.]|nr:hypothetical protein [Sandarakinorhabdus sp.]
MAATAHIIAKSNETTEFSNFDQARMRELRNMLALFTIDGGMKPFGCPELLAILKEIEALASTLDYAYAPNDAGDSVMDMMNPAIAARAFGGLARLTNLAMLFIDPD